jgi:hypothetical protein
MSRHSVAIWIAVALGSTSLLLAQSAAGPQLPAGSMQAKATTACTECHDARIILQQRLSKAAWTKEVDKMTKWGALVDAQDRDPLIDYLSANFGVDKPEYIAERSQPAAAKRQKK